MSLSCASFSFSKALAITAITGPSKDLFAVSLTTKTIVRQFQYVRVTVALQSQAQVNMTAVEAYLNIQFNDGVRTIRLSGRGA